MTINCTKIIEFKSYCSGTEEEQLALKDAVSPILTGLGYNCDFYPLINQSYSGVVPSCDTIMEEICGVFKIEMGTLLATYEVILTLNNARLKLYA